jgi:peptidyl-prolyl cis-trans isomerase C
MVYRRKASNVCTGPGGPEKYNPIGHAQVELNCERKFDIMKPRGSILLIIFLLSIIAANISALAQTQAPAADKVATVNGTAISREAYDREVNLYQQRAAREGQQLPEFQLQMVKKQILDRMIETELLYQDSRKKDIRIESQAVENQMDDIKKRFPNDAEYQKAIKQMNLSDAIIREQIEKGLAINELVKTQIAEKVKISDGETKEFYNENLDRFKQPEEVKASHILIKVDADATESQKAEARKKIEDVQAKLNKGEDFAALAKEYSEGPSSTRGGDLDYFKRGQMVKPFEDAAFALEIGQVSEIVETPFGLHLIKVFDKKPAGVMAYNEVKDRLEQHLKQQKVKQGVDLYLDGLKKDANIEKFI